MFSLMSRLPVFYILSACWIILFCLLLYIVVYIWHPAQTSNLTLKSEVSNIRGEIVHILRLNEFSKNYSTLNQELKHYKTRLHTPHSQSGLTEKLYKIASNNRVVVLSESNKNKQYDKYRITMKSLLVEGRYSSIRKYLYDLNRLKSMVFIKRIELKNKKKSRKVKASVQLVVYSVP